MCVKLFFIFVSGIWYVICALGSKWDRQSTWEVCLWERSSLEAFQTGNIDLIPTDITDIVCVSYLLQLIIYI